MLGGFFWASLLILLGILMLFGSLPIFRIFVGILLIYLGIQLITNWSVSKEQAVQSIYFGKRTVSLDTNTLQQGEAVRYAVLFGAAEIDISTVEAIKEDLRPIEVEINTIFGSTEIKLNKEIPIKIISSTAFGKTEFPDDTDINFGSYTYRTQEDKKPHLILRTSTAFSKLEIETK
jgi:hypothetical protein